MGGFLLKPEEVPVSPPAPASSPLRPFYIVALAIIVLGGMWGLYRYGEVLRSMGNGKTDALKMAEMRMRFSETFAKLGTITASDIANGFWYTYTDSDGNEHVLYFDPPVMLREDLTDEELEQLADVLAKSRITARGSAKAVAEADLPPALQFHNALYSFGVRGGTTIEVERALEQKVAANRATSDDLFRLSYVYELEGKYADRDRLNRENCVRFGERCENAELLELSGRVIDDAGAPVAGARVEIVSRAGASAATGAEGTYTLKTPVQEMEKLRIRASKRNFSDGYADAILLTKGVSKLSIEDITLESPINIVTIDFARKTVTGSNNSFTADGSVVITTPRSVYEISRDEIVDAHGKPYTEGPIDVYLYEFTKGNPPESLMQLDTFDAVRGYAGNLMKTFGMPYIQFFTQDGEELHVLKSNPMQLTYRIADMDALRQNADQIYEPLTEEDMQFLVSASIGRPYRIDREFLINNQLLRFPAFWVFDRKRGVWDNVGVTVRDVQGTIQTVFYTIRDDRL